jgi:transcriptional regulator with XRE-family HTH domain
VDSADEVVVRVPLPEDQARQIDTVAKHIAASDHEAPLLPDVVETVWGELAEAERNTYRSLASAALVGLGRLEPAPEPDELDRLLGIDLDDPVQRLARHLVANDTEYQRALVHIRRQRKMPLAVVAARMGIGVASVRKFEREDANPTLATLRRYALAVGAYVRTTVSWRADRDPHLRQGEEVTMSERHRRDDEDSSDDEQTTSDDDD